MNTVHPIEKNIEFFFTNRSKGIFVGKLNIRKEKWFNGRTFYPCFYFHILTKRLDFNYCYQSNEYSTSNALMPNKVDIHKVDMNYSFPSTLKDSFRVISKYSLFSLIINGHNTYGITSNNKGLKSFLKSNTYLQKKYYKFIDPEFDPIITGNINNGMYEIRIQFNLVRFHPEIFSLIESFILDFEEYYG